MNRIRHFLYKVQHKIAITREESTFLVVCLVLLCTGLIAQYVYAPHHPAPDAHALAEEQFQARIQELAEAQELEDASEASGEAAPSTGEAAAPSSGGGVVYLNSASQAELESLPGIGPALAERILNYREVIGFFRREDELLDVSGIGPATLENIAPLLEVNRPDEPSSAQQEE